MKQVELGMCYHEESDARRRRELCLQRLPQPQIEFFWNSRTSSWMPCLIRDAGLSKSCCIVCIVGQRATDGNHAAWLAIQKKTAVTLPKQYMLARRVVEVVPEPWRHTLLDPSCCLCL